jgi:hypothetical protein
MTADGVREGIVSAAHPVGSEFVGGLHEMNPLLVTPHRLMPTKSEFAGLMSSQPLKTLEFYKEMEWKEWKRPLYYTSAVRKSSLRLATRIFREGRMGGLSREM